MEWNGPRIAALFIAILTTACSGVTTGPTVTSTQPTTPRTRATSNDRALHIGVLLPASGPGARLTPPLQRAIDLAVSEINSAGGVWGTKVVLEHKDEGSDEATTTTSLEELFVENPVDAVIGPASSRIALGIRDRIAANQMPTCSPLATAIALSSPADNGFFFRTIPSDRLQATAMAEALDRTGAKSVSVVLPDDDYGRTFAEGLQTELGRRNLPILASVIYSTAAKDYRDVAARVFTATHPDALAVIGSGESGARVLAALQSSEANKPQTVVNDAMRGVGSVALGTNVNPNWLDRVEGLAPAAHGIPGPWTALFKAATSGSDDTFAAYAYDCVNLIALAAVAMGTDAPGRLAEGMLSVSRGGVRCTTFAECAAYLGQGRNIDLVGASGELNLADSGDTQGGSFDTFRYDSSGRDFVEPAPITLG